MSVTDTAPPARLCSACSAANSAEARFCLSCGVPFSGIPEHAATNGASTAASLSTPAAAPAPPRPPQMSQGSVGVVGSALGTVLNGAIGGGGDAATQATVTMDMHAAFESASQALNQSGGVVKFVQAPSSLAFEMSRKTLGLTVRYEGLLQIASMGAAQSAVRVQIQPVKGTLTPLFFVGAISSLLMMFAWYLTLNLGLLGLLLGIVASAAQYHTLANTAPREMSEKIVAAMQGSVAILAPKPTVPGKSLLGALTKSAPTNSAPVAPQRVDAGPPITNTIFEQLTQLGTLRDAGILTNDEFDRKKAELLARL